MNPIVFQSIGGCFFQSKYHLTSTHNLFFETPIHYYPFGLVMAGISSKAAGGTENKKGYNGNELQNKEFSDGSGLDAYDFNARTYVPQLGRFIQVDPMTDEGGQESWSPNHFSYNNPIRYNDPDGKWPGPWVMRVAKAKQQASQAPDPARVPAANATGNVAKGFEFGLKGQYQTEPPRGSTVTGIKDTKGATNAAGKTKNVAVVRVDEPHGKVNTPHLNINPKVTGLPDPHTPLTPTQFTGLKTAGQVLDGIDKVAKPVAIVSDAIQLGNAIATDIQQSTGGDNTIVTGSRVVGGWAGAWGGAQGGAAIGAGIGSFFGPGPGTAVGGFFGGIIGGIGGAVFGSKVGETAGVKIVEIKNGN